MEKLFGLIYVQPLHCMILYTFLGVMLWGWIGKIGAEKLWWKVLNAAVFSGVVMAIFYMTVYAREVRPREAVFLPFYSLYAAKFQPELYRTVLMNVFLFVPIGLSLPFALPKKQVLATIAVAFLFSASIEAIQYGCCLGRCEVDDVIANTLGAAIGSLAYVISIGKGNCACRG